MPITTNPRNLIGRRVCVSTAYNAYLGVVVAIEARANHLPPIVHVKLDNGWMAPPVPLWTIDVY